MRQDDLLYLSQSLLASGSPGKMSQHTKEAVYKVKISPGSMLWVNMIRSYDMTGQPSQLKAEAPHSKSDEHAYKSEHFIFSINEPYPGKSFADENTEDWHDKLFSDSKSPNSSKG